MSISCHVVIEESKTIQFNDILRELSQSYNFPFDWDIEVQNVTLPIYALFVAAAVVVVESFFLEINYTCFQVPLLPCFKGGDYLVYAE